MKPSFVGTVPVPVTHWGEPVTIDPLGIEVDRLGPANAEQRADRKKARRAERRASLRRIGITVAIDTLFGLGILVGLVVGSLNPDLVTAVIR